MRNYDEEEEDFSGGEQIQPYFVMERPIEELPTFQASIYHVYSPITVQERLVSDDICHRMYYGKCQNCTQEHYLGTLVTVCNEPYKLYARIK